MAGRGLGVQRVAVEIAAIRQVGVAIRERRVAAGYSQAVLAGRADVDRQYLSRLERGRQNPSLLLLMRIALELDMTLADLVIGVDLDAVELRAVERKSRGPRAPLSRSSAEGGKAE